MEVCCSSPVGESRVTSDLIMRPGLEKLRKALGALASDPPAGHGEDGDEAARQVMRLPAPSPCACSQRGRATASCSILPRMDLWRLLMWRSSGSSSTCAMPGCGCTGSD